jgi:PilZ domain
MEMEKRLEPRVDDSIAQIHECHEDPELVGASIDCKVIDFSCHGLRLKTDYALVPSTLLNISIGTGNEYSSYQLRGEILWTEIIDSNCHMGVLFPEQNGTDLEAWVAFVVKLYTDQPGKVQDMPETKVQETK